MSENTTTSQLDVPVYKAKDFVSDQDVRWCPGCGDYAVLAQLQRVLPDMGIKKEDIAIIAGIGCSSRFPYYMSTFGFHGIHGRALAIASGLKAAHKKLSVWVATGDGDCMSIGGNHFIHALRRNIDLNIMMFNNQIYALTKGQYSPTSRHGQKTKSSPYGVIDYPFNPIMLALGAEGTFVARTIDRNAKHMKEIFLRAAAHKGTSFMDILQNCVIFNDGVFAEHTDKETKEDTTLYLKHGEPLIFGKEKDKAIILFDYKLKVVSVNEVHEKRIIIHDEKNIDLAMMLSRLDEKPGYPTPLGVFFDIERSSYEEEMSEQIRAITEKKGPGKIEDLLYAGGSWVHENGG